MWLRLYQLDRGTPGDGHPVWLTLREPHRPLTYDALRAVMARVNRLLGANWTLHDLRHTFAIRALDGGVPMHEVQDLLGHASLDTLAVYSKPRLEDVVAHHRAVFGPRVDQEEQGGLAGYDPGALSTVMGGTDRGRGASQLSSLRLRLSSSETSPRSGGCCRRCGLGGGLAADPAAAVRGVRTAPPGAGELADHDVGQLLRVGVVIEPAG